MWKLHCCVWLDYLLQLFFIWKVKSYLANYIFTGLQVFSTHNKLVLEDSEKKIIENQNIFGVQTLT
jgi:hypothetical protein